jgi:hypothetical protein
MNDVPVQYFQSVIALQLAVTGALLWNIRYFDRGSSTAESTDDRPNPWLALAVSMVLVATLFGSLYAIRHEGQDRAATAVTIGLSLSVIPILLRVLPPIGSPTGTGARRTAPVTIVGLALYAGAVASLVVVLNG